ncbi:zinc finger protein 729 isoform X2 [Pseudomyrmex gracilis]|uniref:zinc finger protein 729 isoform X2 n=1 Tax=Pseudomyrmex gracilis TaxID=219809 RepID=UPI0009949DCE|nr:zinc finger protein 729 isoform X2 [Pseudomyrmex gracilis]
MEDYEDDDDTHYCIKCSMTIHGLDNYVRHRRSGCRPPDDKKETFHESPSTPTTVSYPEILNADAFFSSLELKSSAKSNNRRDAEESALTLLEKFKKDDREKKDEKKSQMDSDESSVKDKLHSMLPAVSDLDDPTDQLCIQSLKQTDRKRQENVQRMESDQQNWLEDTSVILEDLNLNSENKEIPKFGFRFQQGSVGEDSDDDEEDLEDDDLEEDDSYSDSDDGENRERPPRGHTGGKWKPELDDLPQDMAHMHEDDVDLEDDHQEHPPPTYTGGKWKPAETSQKDEEYESKDTSGQPPPEHTRGKWVPGARTDIESGYWCNPCGRKLASRVVYNRHLLSDLHARRSIREIDRDIIPLSEINLRSRRLAARQTAVKKIPEEPEIKKGKKRKRKYDVSQRILYINCEMCHARVRKLQVGKHLLSHYHCRVAGVNPRNRRERRFLLENMAYVVRQCPFQCASCRFYCNTEETFLLHWRSNLHIETIKMNESDLRCVSCNFCCKNNNAMESHLLSTAHRDVVSMMNGSVPVVIGRHLVLSCTTCDRQFQYNLQLRLHIKQTGHESHTASDAYQQYLKCNWCSKAFRSQFALQRHQLLAHKTKHDDADVNKSETTQLALYYCSYCSINFATRNEANEHRRSFIHKEVVRAHKNKNGQSGKEMERVCPHCDEKQPNIIEHKTHLLDHHPELCHRCPQCNMLFALSQDVSGHTREGKCVKKDELNMVEMIRERKEWKCHICVYSTNSQSDFMYHKILHNGPVITTNGIAKLKTNCVKYCCLICNKLVSRASLANHITQHTGEKPFSCKKCSVSFAKRSDIIIHQKLCKSSESSKLDKTGRARTFICGECGEAFYTKHCLRQHILRHAGKKFKCGQPGCPTVLRTKNELNKHQMLVHDTIKKEIHNCTECLYFAKTRQDLTRHKLRMHTQKQTFSCTYDEHCSYKGKSESHVKRHLRTHEVQKKYKCRFCDYACNISENLRKHILCTNLHPGMTVYECNLCDKRTTNPFETNFAKELCAHLLKAHSEMFQSPFEANRYVYHYQQCS